MEPDKPRVMWRKDRWVHPDDNELQVMPAQVSAYGGFSRAVKAKRLWLSDMADELYDQCVHGLTLPGDRHNDRKKVERIREASRGYLKWELSLIEQGL